MDNNQFADHIKNLIGYHLNNVENHHQRIHNTLQFFERLLDDVNEHNFSQILNSTYATQQAGTTDDVDWDLFSQLKYLFGIGERSTDINVTFPDKSVIHQRINHFLQFQEKNVQQVVRSDSKIETSGKRDADHFIVNQAKELNPALFENEDVLFDYFTQDFNLRERDRASRFSIFSEKLKGTHPELYMPNDTIHADDDTLDSKCLIHRLLIDLPKHGSNGMIGAIQTLIEVFNTKFGKFQHVPDHEEVERLLQEYSSRFSSSIYYPRPPDSNQQLKVPFSFLLNHYLPQLNQYHLKWENTSQIRDKLITHLKNYFSEEGDNRDLSTWNMAKLSQFPVVVKRNDRYYLILGIRYFESSKRKQLIWQNKDKHFWNSFPYFTGNGSMAIPSSPSETKSTEVSNMSINRAVYSAYRYWPFNSPSTNGYQITLDERSISRYVRDQIMNGLEGIIHQLLIHNPLQVLSKIDRIVTEASIAPNILEPARAASSGGPDVVNLFVSKLREHFNDVVQSQLITDIEASGRYELEPSKRDIFSPAHLNLHIDHNIYFWKYSHPETRPIIYIGLVKQQLISYFPYLSSFITNLSNIDVIRLKFFIQSSKFRALVGAQAINYGEQSHTEPVIVDPTQLSRHRFPLQPSYKIETPKITVPDIVEHLPSLLQSMRFCIQHRREAKRNFKLFLRGLFIPGMNTHIEYIQDKVKQFLGNERDNNSDVIEYITLFSRFMNAKWKKPFLYTRVLVPTTREVISKFSRTYSTVMGNMLNPNNTVEPRSGSSSNSLLTNSIEKIEAPHVLQEVTHFIKSEITNEKPMDTKALEESGVIPRRVLEIVKRYTTHTESEIFSRAILLLIDLSINGRQLPIYWRPVISYFVALCRTGTNTIYRSASSLIRSLSNVLELPVRLERYTRDLPRIEQYKGDKFCVVGFIDAVRYTSEQMFLDGPREVYFNHWRLENISPYVTSVFPMEIPSDQSEKWRRMYDSKRYTLQHMLQSMSPSNINPPVLPLIPGELSLFSKQYNGLFDGDVTQNRRDLYKQQLSSLRVTLYDYLFEGLEYRSRCAFDLPDSRVRMGQSVDFIQSDNDSAESTPSDLLLHLTLLTKRILRKLEQSQQSNRIKLAIELKDIVQELVIRGRGLVKSISLSSQKLSSKQQTLVRMLEHEFTTFDSSEKWCKSLLDKKMEINNLISEIDKEEILGNYGGSCLTSIAPFMEDVVINEEQDFQFLGEQGHGHEQKATCESAIGYFTKKRAEEVRTKLFPSIGDWDDIACFGKAKTLDDQWNLSNVVTLEDAAFMPNEDRPLIYRNLSPPEPPVRELFMDCEILLASGEWSLEGDYANVKLDHPLTRPLNRMSHVDQQGVGWMNLDDFIAPGINTGFQGPDGETEPPSYEWVHNFKYYAGEKLDTNMTKFKREKAEKQDLWYMTYDDHSMQDRKIRQSIPLWNLEFFFLSGRSWQNMEDGSHEQ